MRKTMSFLVGIVVLIVLGIASIVWVFGPTYGVALVGKPVFLFPPSPQRYANTVFDLAERQGIYAGNKEFSSIRQRAEKEIDGAKTVADTYPHIDSVLNAAGGKHSTLLVPGVVPEPGAPGQLPTVGNNGGIISVQIPSHDVNSDGQQYADAAAVPLTTALEAGSCGVIIDLRANNGGDLGPMLAAVSPVLPNGDVLWFATPSYEIPVTIDGNSVTGGGSPTSASVEAKFDVPTAVLVDEKTASSGEAAMLAFRGLENSTSFGTPTAGYASANIAFEMPDGARILLTTAQDKARTGELFAEDPINPDVLTRTPEDSARAWLAENGCA